MCGLKMAETVSGMIKLSSSNYSIWKPRMEDILYCKDLHEPIQGDEDKPSTKSAKDCELMHRKMVAYIRQWVDESVFHHVAKEVSKELQSIKAMQEEMQTLHEDLTFNLVKLSDGKKITTTSLAEPPTCA